MTDAGPRTDRKARRRLVRGALVGGTIAGLVAAQLNMEHSYDELQISALRR